MNTIFLTENSVFKLNIRSVKKVKELNVSDFIEYSLLRDLLKANLDLSSLQVDGETVVFTVDNKEYRIYFSDYSNNFVVQNEDGLIRRSSLSIISILMDINDNTIVFPEEETGEIENENIDGTVVEIIE